MPPQEGAVVRDGHEGSLEAVQRRLERLAGVDVEVVGRLVEQQEVVTLELEAEDLQARLLAAAEQVVPALRRLREAVARERAHGRLQRAGALHDDVEHDPAGEVVAQVELGEAADRDAVADPDLAAVDVRLAGEGAHEMGLAAAVGADQADALAEVDLVGERLDEPVDADALQHERLAGRIGAADADLDLLVGDRARAAGPRRRSAASASRRRRPSSPRPASSGRAP